jgi:hypothetical protein
MRRPLDGLSVVDCRWGVAGSTASMVLAGCGALVVKAERTEPAADAGAAVRKAWDRGKWSVTHDPDDAAGAASLRGPWRDRPVFESLVAARFGLMAEQDGPAGAPIRVSESKDEVLGCSISGGHLLPSSQ